MKDALAAANGLRSVEKDRAWLLGINVPADLVVQLENGTTLTDDGGPPRCRLTWTAVRVVMLVSP